MRNSDRLLLIATIIYFLLLIRASYYLKINGISGIGSINSNAPNLKSENFGCYGDDAATATVAHTNNHDALEKKLIDDLLLFKKLLNCKNKNFSPRILQRGNYTVLENHIRAGHGEFDCYKTITYTTHMDYTYLSNVLPLLQRWQAPISISLYTPGHDYQTAIEYIMRLRNCGSKANKKLVKDYATFHFIFDNQHYPIKILSDNVLNNENGYKFNACDCYKTQRIKRYNLNFNSVAVTATIRTIENQSITAATTTTTTIESTTQMTVAKDVNILIVVSKSNDGGGGGGGVIGHRRNGEFSSSKRTIETTTVIPKTTTTTIIIDNVYNIEKNNNVIIPSIDSVVITTSYKKYYKLNYPINIARNVARDAALTHFILASDVELYPSEKLVETFMKMIRKKYIQENINYTTTGNDLIASNSNIAAAANATNNVETREIRRIVYSLPVFEISSNSAIILPRNKDDLLQLIRKNQSFIFHEKICRSCHMIPCYEQWLKIPYKKELSSSCFTRRIGKFQHWESIYIGTNNEPYYDERLTWEGKSDKMTQGHIMCLLDYEFHVLDVAFLFHKAGIKTKKQAERKELENKTLELIKNVIRPELELLYGKKDECKRI